MNYLNLFIAWNYWQFAHRQYVSHRLPVKYWAVSSCCFFLCWNLFHLLYYRSLFSNLIFGSLATNIWMFLMNVNEWRLSCFFFICKSHCVTEIAIGASIYTHNFIPSIAFQFDLTPYVGNMKSISPFHSSSLSCSLARSLAIWFTLCIIQSYCTLDTKQCWLFIPV